VVEDLAVAGTDLDAEPEGCEPEDDEGEPRQRR
jgi:hypothetical protein